MKYLKRITALLMLGSMLATSGIAIASEAGRKNTRNALGAATVYMAVKGNKGGALLGAAGTIAAQHQLDKSIRQRHERDAYRRGRASSYGRSGYRHHHRRHVGHTHVR